MKTITREEHLAWCKERALRFVEDGQLREAFASITSDLAKHPDTREHTGTKIGFRLLCGGYLETPERMTKFINGFH